MGNRKTEERNVIWINPVVDAMYDPAYPRRHLLPHSPVPPGYFCGLGVKTDLLTGKDFARDLSGYHTEARLVEALYCQDGCNRGEGVQGL